MRFINRKLRLLSFSRHENIGEMCVQRARGRDRHGLLFIYLQRNFKIEKQNSLQVTHRLRQALAKLTDYISVKR